MSVMCLFMSEGKTVTDMTESELIDLEFVNFESFGNFQYQQITSPLPAGGTRAFLPTAHDTNQLSKFVLWVSKFHTSSPPIYTELEEREVLTGKQKHSPSYIGIVDVIVLKFNQICVNQFICEKKMKGGGGGGCFGTFVSDGRVKGEKWGDDRGRDGKRGETERRGV